MHMKISNVMGNRYSGTIGKAVIASSWRGIKYIRAYKVPRDPKTKLQLRHRTLFARAVETWHSLEPRQRELYNRVATRMTGYNLFIKNYIEAAREGRELDILDQGLEISETADVVGARPIGASRAPPQGPTGTISQRPGSPPPSPPPVGRRCQT